MSAITIYNQNVSFKAKLKHGNTVTVFFAQQKGKVLICMYFIKIDQAAPVLFDVRKCVENKEHFTNELVNHKDKLFRTAAIKRELANVTTDFILRNLTQQE